MPTTTAFECQPVTPGAGAVIEGIDTASPLTEDAKAFVRNCPGDHGVVLFRNQVLTDDQMNAFASQFAPTMHEPFSPEVNPNTNPAGKDPDYSVADHGLAHFGVEVEDIERTYQRMVAAGVRVHSPVTRFPGGMKATYGRDPDGNVFELVERETNPEEG